MTVARIAFAAVALLAAGLLVAEEKPQSEEGFVPLFDGATLNGWQGGTEGDEVKDGILICKRHQRHRRPHADGGGPGLRRHGVPDPG